MKARLVDKSKSMNPRVALSLANDFRWLASKGGFSSGISRGFLDAADSLGKAFQGEQTLEAARQPGGPLALTPDEVGEAESRHKRQYAKLLEERKDVGVFRAPEMAAEVKSAEDNLARVEAAKKRYGISGQQPSVNEDAGYSPQSQMFRAMPEKNRPLQVGNIERGFLDNLQDLGIESSQFKHSLLQAFDAMGLKDSDRMRRVPPALGLRRAMEVLDPSRVMASYIRDATRPQAPGPGEEPQPPASDGAAAMPSRRDKVEQELDAKRERLKGLFQELMRRDFMTTWGGIISFVLLSLVTRSPVFAAQIMLRMSGKDAVEFEIKNLEREIEQDQRRSDREEDRDLRMRTAAANMILKQSLATQSQDAAEGRLKMSIDARANEARERHPEQKEYIDGLEMMFRNYTVLANRAYKDAVDPLTGMIRDPESKEAQEYAFYKGKQDQLGKDIEKLLE